MEKLKCSMRHRYQYYREQNAHQKFHANFQQEFQRDFPNFSTWLKQKQNQKPAKDQTTSFSHWLLLTLFGLMAVATFTQQLLFLLLFLVIAAVIKGPGMIIWGVAYSFLVSLFPPLGILLSGIFFLLTLRQVTNNWQFGLTAGFFYGWPFVLTALRQFSDWSPHLITYGGLGIGLVALHFLLRSHYLTASSKSLAWSLLALPYDCIIFFIPSKRKARQRPRFFSANAPIK